MASTTAHSRNAAPACIAGEIDDGHGCRDAGARGRGRLGGAPYVPPRRPFNFGRWFRATGWRHVVGIVMVVFALFPIVFVDLVVAEPAGHPHRVERAVLRDRPRQLRAHPHRPAGAVPAVVREHDPHRRRSRRSARCSSAALAAYSFSRMRFTGRRFGLISIVVVQMFPQMLAVVAIFLLMSSISDWFPAIGLEHAHRPDHGVPRRRAGREHLPHVRLLQHDPRVDRRGREDRRRGPRPHLLHDHPAARGAHPRGGGAAVVHLHR